MPSKFETNQKLSDFNKEEIENKKLIPSSQLAWMLGILSGGGNVCLKKTGGAIHFYTHDENILNKFKFIGQDLFKSNPILSKREGRSYQMITFYNKKIAEELGDFRSRKWSNTLMEKYKWIFKNKQYLWNFLEGLFEARGFINYDSKKEICKDLGFYVSHHVNFVSDLLIRVDINKPRINTWGVRLSSWEDMKTFADNIYSVSLKKEKMLEIIRNQQYRVEIKDQAKRNKQTKFEEKREQKKKEAIAEWILVKKLLGHAPSKREIRVLKQNKDTRFSPEIYKYRFGRASINEKRGNFSLAKKELEKITRDGVQP